MVSPGHPSPRASVDGFPSPMESGDTQARVRLLGQLASEQVGMVSLTPALDTSPIPGDDASPEYSEDGRRCQWCRGRLSATARPDALFCGKPCRQAAWRARRVELAEHGGQRLIVAYADPPYPGTARRYYADQPNYRGEVDHVRLLSLLQQFDGWGLSTSEKALRRLLPLCPDGVRVAPWVKPIGASRRTRGPHNTWEPLLYKPARLVRPGVRDWLRAKPARLGGDLHGRKPEAYVRWLFALLGMAPGDFLLDFFPGTEIAGKVWAQFSGRPPGDFCPTLPIEPAAVTSRNPDCHAGRSDAGGHG